ncbi:hypothetical protein AKO1_012612 [Acrasis kona]|uniref:Rhodanese domain-containing protein n=1 Tax=Acrasis kona TaxID=1008807 RepID=A0AAW2YVT4_9EUKA
MNCQQDMSMESFYSYVNSIRIEYEKASLDFEQALQKKEMNTYTLQQIESEITSDLLPRYEKLIQDLSSIQQEQQEYNWYQSSIGRELDVLQTMITEQDNRINSLHKAVEDIRLDSIKSLDSYPDEHVELMQLNDVIKEKIQQTKVSIAEDEKLLQSKRLHLSQARLHTADAHRKVDIDNITLCQVQSRLQIVTKESDPLKESIKSLKMQLEALYVEEAHIGMSRPVNTSTPKVNRPKPPPFVPNVNRSTSSPKTNVMPPRIVPSISKDQHINNQINTKSAFDDDDDEEICIVTSKINNQATPKNDRQARLQDAEGEIVVAALYKFVTLTDYVELRTPLQDFMKQNDIKGLLLLAQEGINGTVAGTRTNIDLLLDWLRKDPRFLNIEHKESYCDVQPFRRTKVKLKKEIVNLGVDGVDPNNLVGHYVEPQEWNEIISDPDVVLIDTRNDYEIKSGTFENALNPQTKRFSEFPTYIENNFNPSKHKKVAMFCTGGIRCEKASSYMLNQGFEKVYHLKGGILKYLETVPQEQSMYKGDCFVFDGRVTVKHDLSKGDHTSFPEYYEKFGGPSQQEEGPI